MAKEYTFDFQAAGARLQDVLHPTSLIYAPDFIKGGRSELYIKPENLQTTGSFKIRGAYNKIAKLDEAQKKRGLVTASAGNHAQGVAYAAKHLGIAATIVMPKITPFLKVDRTRSYGVDVVLEGDNFDEANAHCLALAKEKGMTLIPPFDDYDVIEGQGTIAREILDELPDADLILVPVGGGGLIAGIAACAKEINPKIRIIGVESVGYDSMHISVEKGAVSTLTSTRPTIADGTAVATPGEKTFALARKWVDEWIQITDYELMVSFVDLLSKQKIIAEPSGLLSLAAASKLALKGKKMVSVVSGGNIDLLTVSELVTKGMTFNGRIVTVRVELDNRPGTLVKLLKTFSEQRVNIIQVEHDMYKNQASYNGIQVSVTAQTNGKAHIEQLLAALYKEGYGLTLE
uniref:threonine ammonia-lyase n=1 Tax=Ndongobacter massiliensis TaxID=1871025 RepID=UPI000930E48A|nr:threonine ammonia-lyase [Ndongobacter massiliensis]